MSGERYLADDAGARVAALDPRRSFIVQAPAGSGKTELLVQRYLTLLPTVEQPEEVLAITFTRKAAEEMQLRVMAALERAAGADEPREEHERITFRAARRVLDHDRKGEWQLSDAPRRLRILTLDALNAGIAAALPMSSGLGSGVRVLADEENREWYGAAGAATLDWLLAGADSPECAAVEQVLAHLDNSTDAYIEHIAAMLATRDQWLPLVGSGAGPGLAVRDALERNIAARVTACLEKVRTALPQAMRVDLARLVRHAGENLGEGTSAALAPLAGLAGLPAASADRLIEWQAIAELLLTRTGSVRKSVNRNHGFAPGSDERTEMLALLERLAEDDGLRARLHGVRRLPEPRYQEEQWSVLQALFRLLPLAAAELRRLFREHGVTDYVEVSDAADRALGGVDDPGDVALLLDHGIRHLLIDEMQDTSLAQYRLLEKLVAGWQAGDGRTLFCVGDPMQSIYRFRDAEVGQFLLARKRGIGGVALGSLVLRRNFRSAEGLVRWFNDVFGRIFPAADDVATGAISYAASTAAAQGPFAGLCRVHPVIGADADEEARQGLGAVGECLAGSRPDESVAVLVRSRTQLAPLLEKLRTAGIPYRAIEIDRLTDVPEIIELRALTRALCHRGDRVAWLGLLRGPLVGLPWRDLHALVRNDAARTVWELLHDELRLTALSDASRERVSAFVEALEPHLECHGTRSLRETVERAWYALAGPLLAAEPDAVDNVFRFLDVVERAEVAGTLDDVADLEARLDRERVHGGSGGAHARLQVMTIHRAKGLEFDHVVLYGLGRRSRSEDKSVLSWLALPGGAGDELLISPVGPRSEIENDPLHAWIEAAGREKDRLEQDRLLYVACTRARQSLHLVGHVEAAPGDEGPRSPPDATLLGGIWPCVRAEFETAFARARGEVATPRRAGAWTTPRLRRLPASAAMPPAPALPPGTLPPVASDQDPAPQVAYDWVGSRTRQAGTLVHRWLQRIADAEHLLRPPELADTTRRWALELGVPTADVDDVCKRVAAAVDRILADERGRWLLTGTGHAELAISGRWNGRIETVVLDRVRIGEDGVHWIVDYKTGVHEGSDRPRFLEQEAERYRAQLAKYARLYRNLTDAPVRTALYFPLLGEFLPVEKG